MAYTEATARRNVYWRHNLALEASRPCQMEDLLRLEQQTHTVSCRHVIGVSSYFVLFFLTDIHSNRVDVLQGLASPYPGLRMYNSDI